MARERELADLAAALETTRAGEGQILFVIGGAGRGKTMLVQEFARRAQALDDELIVVSGYCNAHTGVGDPYPPFREALSMLISRARANPTKRGKVNVPPAGLDSPYEVFDCLR